MFFLDKQSFQSPSPRLKLPEADIKPVNAQGRRRLPSNSALTSGQEALLLCRVKTRSKTARTHLFGRRYLSLVIVYPI
jgi:hypothetical protein